MARATGAEGLMLTSCSPGYKSNTFNREEEPPHTHAHTSPSHPELFPPQRFPQCCPVHVSVPAETHCCVQPIGGTTALCACVNKPLKTGFSLILIVNTVNHSGFLDGSQLQRVPTIKTRRILCLLIVFGAYHISRLQAFLVQIW